MDSRAVSRLNSLGKCSIRSMQEMVSKLWAGNEVCGTARSRNSLLGAVSLPRILDLGRGDVESKRLHFLIKKSNQCPGTAAKIEVPAGLADLRNDSAELVVMPFALDTRSPVKNGIIVTGWDRIIGVSHGRDQRPKSIFPYGVNTIPSRLDLRGNEGPGTVT